MSGHTPGPWKAHNQDVTVERELGDDGVRFWDVVGEGPWRGAVCTVHSAVHIDGISLDERDANARLIATAPDMLAACESVIPKGVCLTNKNIPDDFTVSLDCTMGDLRNIAAAIAKARGEA